MIRNASYIRRIKKKRTRICVSITIGEKEEEGSTKITYRKKRKENLDN
jgi:hypothetical protein